MAVRADVLACLGLDVEQAESVEEHLADEATGRTEIPGVWVAGNVMDPTAQVTTAAAAGLKTAMAINVDLVEEDVERAVAARRAG